MTSGKCSPSQTWITRSPEETKNIGKTLVRHCEKGDVIGLQGKLGAGKTVFVKGMAQELQVPNADQIVRSPTYTLQNVYEGKIDLFHCDAYRLNQPEQLEALGWPAQFPEGITAIEWVDRLKPNITPYLTTEMIFTIQSPSKRTLKLRGEDDS